MQYQNLSHRSHGASAGAHDEYHNPFIVRRLSDLFALGGLWVAMMVLGQLAVSCYLAVPLGRSLAVAWPVVAAMLAGGYLMLDVALFLVLRGRMISQWLMPAMWLAAAAVVPGFLVYGVQVIHKL